MIIKMTKIQQIISASDSNNFLFETPNSIFHLNFCSQAADLSKPVDKKIYKGTNPTCHDFNTVTTTYNSVSLLIGFSTGQIQIFDPIKKEISKLYNEEVRFQSILVHFP